MGYPAPKTATGRRAQPFWSSRSRAEKVIATVAAYATFRPEAVAWEEFCHTWVSDLEHDGLPVGVNWGEPRATGFDLEPAELRRDVEALIANPSLAPGSLTER